MGKNYVYLWSSNNKNRGAKPSQRTNIDQDFMLISIYVHGSAYFYSLLYVQTVILSILFYLDVECVYVRQKKYYLQFYNKL